MEWYTMVWTKYADFKGRATRKEYWMFQLLNLVMILALSMLGFIFQRTGSGPLGYLPAGIYILAAAVPSLAVSARRLHDSGKSAWFLLLFAALGMIPYLRVVSFLIQVIFYCLDSDPGTNKYAINPMASIMYRNAAEEGDAAAQYNLGIMYDHGRDVPRDYTQSSFWYRRAAEQGYAPAQSNLGAAFCEGQGVSRDLVQGAAWYTKAAEQGDTTAQFNLGAAYYDGQGVPQDFAEACFWLSLAELGEPEGIATENVAKLRADASSRLDEAALAQIRDRVQKCVEVQTAKSKSL